MTSQKASFEAMIAESGNEFKEIFRIVKMFMSPEAAIRDHQPYGQLVQSTHFLF